MSGPRVTSGVDSEQVVGTPRELLAAVEARFGALDFDLAATRDNSVVGGDGDSHFGPGSALANDSLLADWSQVDGNLFLNPPFKKIKAWAKKCAETPAGPTTRRIFFLVPLTTANWACDYVHGKAMVLGLAPRVKFVGHKTAFPKDLVIAVYGLPPGFEAWQWAPRRRAGGKKPRKPSNVGSTAHGDLDPRDSGHPGSNACRDTARTSIAGCRTPQKRLPNHGIGEASPPRVKGEGVTSPGEQRALFGGDGR